MKRQETVEALKELLSVWETVYAAAKEQGPHNPRGTDERAEELTRAYMAGKLRIPLA